MSLEPIEQELAALNEAGLLRTRRTLESAQGTQVRADGRAYLSFCSNDYLGLAAAPAVIQAAQQAAEAYGVGAGASHLVSGHLRLHAQLEEALAAFVGMPQALLFSTGYMANLGVASALLGRHDEVFADRLNHASLNDGALLSRARFSRYAHLDLAMLEKQLARSSAPRKLVVTDAVFSMDGDVAPIPELLALCERYAAFLMVDDAHGFGVRGENGAGSLPAQRSPRLIYMATLGKAAGVSGAFVAADRPLIQLLLNRARTFVFTTAMPAPLAGALLKSLELIQTEAWRRTHLAGLIQRLRSSLRLGRFQLMASETPIQPVLVGGNREVVAASEQLLQAGIWVPAIRPPTVPRGQARLRISLSAAHQAEDIDRLVQALHAIDRAG
jgi:8-amino-7-oxononanoate synthase